MILSVFTGGDEVVLTPGESEEMVRKERDRSFLLILSADYLTSFSISAVPQVQLCSFICAESQEERLMTAVSRLA